MSCFHFCAVEGMRVWLRWLRCSPNPPKLSPAVWSKIGLGAVQGTGAAESLQDGTALGQGNPLEKFGRQVALLKQACITPSGMDEELRSVASLILSISWVLLAQKSTTVNKMWACTVSCCEQGALLQGHF